MGRGLHLDCDHEEPEENIPDELAPPHPRRHGRHILPAEERTALAPGTALPQRLEPVIQLNTCDDVTIALSQRAPEGRDHCEVHACDRQPQPADTDAFSGARCGCPLARSRSDPCQCLRTHGLGVRCCCCWWCSWRRWVHTRHPPITKRAMAGYHLIRDTDLEMHSKETYSGFKGSK